MGYTLRQVETERKFCQSLTVEALERAVPLETITSVLQSIAVYTTPEASIVLSEVGILGGEAVLPECSLSVGKLFAELDWQSDDAPTLNP